MTLIDLPNFGGIALVMLLVGLLAGFVPARRASGVGPIRSLASRGFVRESVVSHPNLGNGRRWRSIMKKICGAFPLGLLVLAMQPCSPPDPPAAEPELVYADHTPNWYEAGRKLATVSPDGAWALYGSGNTLRLIDLARKSFRDGDVALIVCPSHCPGMARFWPWAQPEKTAPP